MKRLVGRDLIRLDPNNHPDARGLTLLAVKRNRKHAEQSENKNLHLISLFKSSQSYPRKSDGYRTKSKKPEGNARVPDGIRESIREWTGAPCSPRRTWAEKDGRSPSTAFAAS